jgi:hypothetical protein
MGNPLKKENLGGNMTGGHGAVPYFTAFMNVFMKDKPKDKFYQTPSMPKDIQALKEQRQREESEKGDDSLMAVRTPRLSRNAGNSDTLEIVDGKLGDGSSAPKLDRITEPKSHAEDEDNAPLPKSTVITVPKPVTPAAPVNKKPDGASENESRPHIVEPPKKKGKKGEDDN